MRFPHQQTTGSQHAGVVGHAGRHVLHLFILPSSATQVKVSLYHRRAIMIEVIIVGGSVGGLACAHALLKSGNFRITVLERASSIKAAGAVSFKLLLSVHMLECTVSCRYQSSDLMHAMIH